MGDVRIRHCTLRLIRHGGWSWGPHPHQLLDQACEAIPRLLEDALNFSERDAGDLRIAQPVRLRLPLRLPIDAGQIRRALDGALAEALPVADSAFDTQPSARTPAQRVELSSTKPTIAVLADAASRSALVRLLGDWLEQGLLPPLLERIPAPLLNRWRSVLQREVAAPSHIFAPRETASTDQPIAQLQARLHANPAPPTLIGDRNSVAILLLVLAAQKPQITLSAGQLERLLDRVTGAQSQPARQASSWELALAPPHSARDAPSHLAAADSIGTIRQPALQPKPSQAPTTEWACEVTSCIPFLVLGELSRLGWIRTLTGCLSGAGLEPEAAVLATMLAYKCLQPPSRGWRRGAATVRAAATFAGLREPKEESHLARIADALAEALMPLDTWLTARLAHDGLEQQPLLLHRLSHSERSWLLLELGQSLPIAWCTDHESLLERLTWLGDPLLLVGTAAADAALLAKIDAAGLRFVTRARPVRGEPWRPVAHTTGIWSNTPTESAGENWRTVLETDAAERRAEAIDTGVFRERPACVAHRCDALDRMLSVAAGTGLARIAATLWSKQEATSPLLTLQRFGDLSARVMFDPTRVRVHLPLGRRSMDLRKHGALECVAEVPWLDGRVLEFTGV